MSRRSSDWSWLAVGIYVVIVYGTAFGIWAINGIWRWVRRWYYVRGLLRHLKKRRDEIAELDLNKFNRAKDELAGRLAAARSGFTKIAEPQVPASVKAAGIEKYLARDRDHRRGKPVRRRPNLRY
jgi:hypothetical protein